MSKSNSKSQTKSSQPNSEDYIEDIPLVIRRFIDMSLKRIINKCWNMSEICYIIRKLMTRRPSCPKAYNAIMKYLMDKNILNILLDNIYELKVSK